MFLLLLRNVLCFDSAETIIIGADLFHYYKLSSRELSIRSGPNEKPKSPILIIPKDINAGGSLVEVVDVYENAFLGTQFEEISLPESVKTIGKSTFAQSKYLRKVDLSKTKIVNIPSKCFSDSSITSILLPDSLQIIDMQCFKKTSITEFIFSSKMTFGISGNMCFMWCQYLSIVDMSQASIKSIPKSSFDGCTSLSQIKFSCNVEKFEDSSFRETAIEEIIIPETVRHIGEKVFQNCLKLKSVDVSKSMIVSIHKDTFFGCKSLKFFTDDNHIQEISQNAFAGSGIKSYTFRNVVVIEKFCFQSCHFLETADFTDSKVEAIPQGSFMDCTSLSTLKLPLKLLGISLGAFQAANISEIIFPETVAELGIKCFADSSHLALADLTQCQSIAIISAYTFYNCSKLSKIYLPKTVRRIHEYAFYGIALKRLICNSTLRFINNHCFAASRKLEEVDMSGSQIISISAHCFENCSNLRNIKFSPILSSINTMCLSGTKITNLEFPDTLKSFEAGALYGCRYLQSADFTKCKLLSKFENASFCNCTKLEFVLFPPTNIRIMNQCFSFSSVRSLKLTKCELIGEYAFYGCRNLEIVDISSTSVKEIPKMAFRKCTKLETVELPKSLRNIGAQAFSHCGFSEINLPNTLVDISMEAFANCTKLKSINLERTYVTIISKGLLYGCCNLSSIVISTSLKAICSQAFAYTSITTLSIQRIDANSTGAFSHMIKLLSIKISEIGDGIIPDSLFEDCTSLSNITILSSITRIGNKAFFGCAISKLNLEKSIFNLGVSAYQNCTQLIIADLSQSSIIEIPSNLFKNCFKLSKVSFPRLTSKYGKMCLSNTAISEFVFSNYVKDYGDGMFGGCHNLTEVSMKESVVTQIHPNTFENCYSLVKVSLPGKIVNIGAKSFKNTAITNIEIPSEVKCIGSFAFAYCINLTKISMENSSVSTIECSAFYGCFNLKEAKIPSLVKTINKSAFAQTGIEEFKAPVTLTKFFSFVFDSCKNLKKADFSDTFLTEIPSHTFFKCVSLEKILLPPDIKSISKLAFAYTSINEFIGTDNLITINEGAFKECNKLITADLQKSKITYISKETFMNCTLLNNIILPSDLTEICDSAFAGTSIENILIPSMVENIKNFAFMKSSLNSIDLTHTAIKSISNGVFNECKKLNSILFPKTTKLIGSESFLNCMALKVLDLKETELESIEAKAFESCTELSKVLLAPSINNIGIGAFANCIKLSSVIYCGKNIIVGKAVFDRTTNIYVTEGFPSNYFAGIEVSVIEKCPENVNGNITIKVARSSQIQRQPLSIVSIVLILVIVILVFVLILLIRLKKKQIPISRIRDDVEQRTSLLNHSSNLF